MLTNPILRRIGVVGIAGVVAFGVGWQVNGWRLNAQIDAVRAARAEAIAKALEAREQELAERFREQQAAARERELALNETIRGLGLRTLELEREITREPLTRVEYIEGDCDDISPFSDRFRDLWNAGIGLHDGAASGDHLLP